MLSHVHSHHSIIMDDFLSPETAYYTYYPVFLLLKVSARTLGSARIPITCSSSFYVNHMYKQLFLAGL